MHMVIQCIQAPNLKIFHWTTPGHMLGKARVCSTESVSRAMLCELTDCTHGAPASISRCTACTKSAIWTHLARNQKTALQMAPSYCTDSVNKWELSAAERNPGFLASKQHITQPCLPRCDPTALPERNTAVPIGAPQDKALPGIVLVARRHGFQLQAVLRTKDHQQFCTVELPQVPGQSGNLEGNSLISFVAFLLAWGIKAHLI